MRLMMPPCSTSPFSAPMFLLLLLPMGLLLLLAVILVDRQGAFSDGSSSNISSSRSGGCCGQVVHVMSRGAIHLQLPKRERKLAGRRSQAVKPFSDLSRLRVQWALLQLLLGKAI